MLKYFEIAVLVSFAATIAHYDYGIVIDAGSKHTGLFIFKWEQRITSDPFTRPKSNPVCPDGWSMKIRPGFAHFAWDNDPSSQGLHDYLSPLFKFAKETLKEHDISKIPVFFGATAGVRLVTYKKRHALMNKIRSYIHSTGFQFNDIQAHVLSGEEEAMFNWVTVNHLNWLDGGDASSVGVLDLGGASLEAAYETPYDILDGWIQVDLFEREYRLYGRSYLQLGVTEAFRSMILQTQVDSMDTNPCIPTGCTLDYLDTKYGFNKTLIGSSSPATCSNFIQAVIEANLPCHFPMDPNGKTECHAYGQYAPPQFDNMTFYGVDGFWDFTHELKLWVELGQKKTHTAISLPVIKSYADLLCTNEWEDLKIRFPKADESYLSQACFLGTFIYEILTKGLGFREDFSNFIFADKVNKSPLGWAPGLMIYQVDKMPVACPSCAFQPPKPTALHVLNSIAPAEGQKWMRNAKIKLDQHPSSHMTWIIIILTTILLFGSLLYMRAKYFNNDAMHSFSSSRWRYTQLV